MTKYNTFQTYLSYWTEVFPRNRETQTKSSLTPVCASICMFYLECNDTLGIIKKKKQIKMLSPDLYFLEIFLLPTLTIIFGLRGLNVKGSANLNVRFYINCSILGNNKITFIMCATFNEVRCKSFNTKRENHMYWKIGKVLLLKDN